MTNEEAENLILTLKKLTEKLIEIPSLSQRNEYEAYSINDSRQRFRISIYRGNRDPEKISFHAIDKITKINLMRLDVVNKSNCHKNPDGQIIHGPHLHIYKDGYELKEAVEFNIENPNLVKYCLEFLKKFNIIDIDKNKVLDIPTLF